MVRRMAMILAAVLLAAPAAALAVATQPTDERAAQKTLRHSNDPLWSTLKNTQVRSDAKRGPFVATPSASVKALAGQSVTISGFMLPIESDLKTTHFLLSKYTPVCFFCPPGQPNEIVEVHTVRPVAAGYDRIKLKGRFSLQNNGEQGLFFRLDQAAVTP